MFGGLLGVLIALKIVGYDYSIGWLVGVGVCYFIVNIWKTYLYVMFVKYIEELFKHFLSGGGA